MHKQTQLKYGKGDGSLLFLLTHALEGYGRATVEPLLPVSQCIGCSYSLGAKELWQ